MSEVSNGKTALAGYVQAFERVNGRTPTDEENREALALVDVCRGSGLDPFLVFYLANKKAQIEMRSVMDEATARIKAAAPMTEKALAAFAERLERVEQGVDNLAKQPAAVPAIPSDMASSMARLAEQLRYAAATADPFANAAKYFGAFLAGALMCEALFAATAYSWLSPRVFDHLGMFCLGLSATAFVLVWLWLAPIVSRRGR